MRGTRCGVARTPNEQTQAMRGRDYRVIQRQQITRTYFQRGRGAVVRDGATHGAVARGEEFLVAAWRVRAYLSLQRGRRLRISTQEVKHQHTASGKWGDPALPTVELVCCCWRCATAPLPLALAEGCAAPAAGRAGCAAARRALTIKTSAPQCQRVQAAAPLKALACALLKRRGGARRVTLCAGAGRATPTRSSPTHASRG